MQLILHQYERFMIHAARPLLQYNANALYWFGESGDMADQRSSTSRRLSLDNHGPEP
jgi:hypothetical protein